MVSFSSQWITGHITQQSRGLIGLGFKEIITQSGKKMEGTIWGWGFGLPIVEVLIIVSMVWSLGSRFRIWGLWLGEQSVSVQARSMKHARIADISDLTKQLGGKAFHVAASDRHWNKPRTLDPKNGCCGRLVRSECDANLMFGPVLMSILAGPVVSWSSGPLFPWSSVPLVLWSPGPLVSWSAGLWSRLLEGFEYSEKLARSSMWSF